MSAHAWVIVFWVVITSPAWITVLGWFFDGSTSERSVQRWQRQQRIERHQSDRAFLERKHEIKMQQIDDAYRKALGRP